MKKTIRMIALVSIIAMATLSMTGCEWLLEIILEPYANVQNQAGDPIEGVTVSLYSSATFSSSTLVSQEDSSATGYVGFGTDFSAGTYYMVATDGTYDGQYYTFPDYYRVSVEETAQFLGYVTGAVPDNAQAISGFVLNAKTTSTKVSGVALTLTDSAGEEAGTTTSAALTGNFSFSDVTPGEYVISGVLTDTAVIDTPVTVFTGGVTGVEVLAFTAPDEYTISIFVVWADDFSDVDAYLTYPNTYLGGANPPVLSSPYYYPETTYPGYVAETGSTSTRAQIYFYNPNSTLTMDDLFSDGDTGRVALLDRDDIDGKGPETITLRAVPFDWYGASIPHSSYLTLGTSLGLPTGSYAWLGTAEYYLDGYSPDYLSTEGTSGGSEAVVYVTQGSTVKGRYVIPDYTTLDEASVLRINMFADSTDTEVFQILPDIRVATPGLGMLSVDSPESLVLFGRTR